VYNALQDSTTTLVFVQSAALVFRINIVLVDVLEPQTLFAQPALLAGVVRPMQPADVWEQQILSAQPVSSALAGNIGVLDVSDQLTPCAQTALLVAPININVLRALPQRTDYAKIA
jgi:hypothetical protein